MYLDLIFVFGFYAVYSSITNMTMKWVSIYTGLP